MVIFPCFSLNYRSIVIGGYATECNVLDMFGINRKTFSPLRKIQFSYIFDGFYNF